MKNYPISLGLALAACISTASAVPTRITTIDLSKFPSFGDGNVQEGISDAIKNWNARYDPDLPSYGIGAKPDIKVAQDDDDDDDDDDKEKHSDAVKGFPSFDDDTRSIKLPMGSYNYVFLHWGGPNVDDTYKNPELYYIGDETDAVEFTAPVNHIPAVYFTSGPKKGEIKTPAKDKQYGLSFYSFYSFIPPEPTPGIGVPDLASNAVLFGIGFAGVLGARRFFARR